MLILLTTCGIFAICLAICHAVLDLQSVISAAQTKAEMTAQTTAGKLLEGLENTSANGSRYTSCNTGTCPKIMPNWTPSPEVLFMTVDARPDGKSYSLSVGTSVSVVNFPFLHEEEVVCVHVKGAAAGTRPTCNHSSSTSCDGALSCVLLRVYEKLFLF